MERTLSPEEKIRRAEEIYARRRNGYTTRNVATVSVSQKKNYSLFKKMIIQIAVCSVIYCTFYIVQNSNYIFSQDVINKTKEILSYDIDIHNIWSKFVDGMNNFSNGIVPSELQNEVNSNTIEQTNAITEENAIGGAEPENEIIENSTLASSDENNQDEQKEEIPQTDDEYIKSNFSFIKPVEGIVSSEFGHRDVDNPIVSKNHTGIDLAANTGTQIKAAMEGTVTISSTVGDYGFHIQIENQDVKTLYGHCSKLLVKKGETVKQGQVIAEVGSTGKSTGPHLHFEIKRGNTYINPRNILEF